MVFFFTHLSHIRYKGLHPRGRGLVQSIQVEGGEEGVGAQGGVGAGGVSSP